MDLSLYLPQLIAFLQVVVIDLVLAGDNAVVVGMAAAGLPKDQRLKAVGIGIAVATIARIIFALAATQLLQILGLLLAGGPEQNDALDARLGFRGFPVKHFQKKAASPPFFSCLNGKEIRPVFKPAGQFSCLTHVPATFTGSQRRQLSRKTSAAARTAGCENLAAAGGSHTGAEAMTTLADELGRLVSTLRHLFNTAVCGPS